MPPSNIDTTVPKTGNPTTQAVRDNFAAAKTEIEALQAGAGVIPNRGRNHILNPDFRIWQRGSTHTAPATGEYTADQWRVAFNGSGVFNVNKGATVPPNFKGAALNWVVTTPQPSLGGSDFYLLNHIIEGYNFQHSAYGTSSAQTMVLSFWVRSPKTGIHCVALQNSAQNRSYIAEYVVNQAETFEFKQLVIPGPTTGVWLFEDAIALRISFILAAGTTATAPGVWTNGNFLRSTGQQNLMDAVQTWRLSNVQLELGSTPSSFDNRPITQELQLCQRYYQKTVKQSQAIPSGFDGALHTIAGADGNFVFNWDLQVLMKEVPVITTFNPVGGNANARNINDSTSTPVLATISDNRIVLTPNGVDATDAGDLMAIQVTADATF